MVRSVLSRSPRAANEARREGLLVVYLHGSRTHHWLRSIVGYLALKALVKLGGPLVHWIQDRHLLPVSLFSLPFMFVRFFFFLRQNWYFVVSFKLRVVLHSIAPKVTQNIMTVSLMCDFCLFVCLFYLTAAESSEKSPVSFVVARNIKWRPTSSVTALLGEELKFQKWS